MIQNKIVGKIIEFDATAARRSEMRKRSTSCDAQIPAEAESIASNQAAQSITPQSCLDESELKSFLIDFVVEQTGYPEEIVELDADLEGDLGIDSIKKAQLFGELNEHFDVKVNDNLSLDDFPTLRCVMDYLKSHASRRGETPQVIETKTENSPVAPVSSVASARLDESELKSFLIDFVVEQTGYPEEIVELDADLEGDLGIDSIKKAQLFGELNEHFDVKVNDNLSLDDFPTLRCVMDYLSIHAKPRR